MGKFISDERPCPLAKHVAAEDGACLTCEYVKLAFNVLKGAYMQNASTFPQLTSKPLPPKKKTRPGGKRGC